MEKIFYQNNGCSISDTVFITPKGDQYTIRNISSVKVREKDYWWILAVGIFLLYKAYTTGEIYGFTRSEALLLFLAGLFFIVVWWFSRVFILWIGSGGIHQEALTFKKANSGGLKNIREIYDALNASIANLQNK